MAVAENHDDPPSTRKSGHDGDQNGAWIIEPIPAGLIDSPLDFIFAEHHRQREAASIISMIADDEFDAKGIERLADFLENDFILHIGDEEIALFPILRQHCLPEDNVECVIERLQDEHREDESINDEVVAILRGMLSGEMLTESAKRRLHMFAEHVRQHLALENGVLLPIARVRLAPHVLDTLADMLKERRIDGAR